MNLALSKLLEVYGTQEAIADAFDITQPAIFRWFSRDVVPHDRILLVSEKTGVTPEQILRDNAEALKDKAA